MALYVVVAVALHGSCWAAPPGVSDLVNYDVDSDTWDLNSYGQTYDYDDLDEEAGNARISVSVTQWLESKQFLSKSRRQLKL